MESEGLSLTANTEGCTSSDELTQLQLQEQNTILRTILDLLLHDTRNLFINLHSLLGQLSDSAIRGMLEDSVAELQDSIMEASGYLGGRKRIISILEVLLGLHVTRDRIPLPACSRISVEHCSKLLLFVESTSLIKNAVQNLVENALKYAPDPSPIRISLGWEKGWIQLDVADRGPGVPDAEKELIFSQDYRMASTAAIEGTGKGLWITRNIVQKEGGDVWVHDNPGGGSIFSIRMPAYKTMDFSASLRELAAWYHRSYDEIEKKAHTIRMLVTMQLPEAECCHDSLVVANLLDYLRSDRKEEEVRHFSKKLAQFKQMNSGGKRVLIADDSLYVHYYLGSFMSEFGLQIADYAANGEAAANFYPILRPDLVTMDYTMPVLTGVEAAERMVAVNPEVKIIFITGLGSLGPIRDSIARIMDSRNFRILTKPIKKEDLRKALSEMIGPLPEPVPK